MRTRSESTLNVIWSLLVRGVLFFALGYIAWRVRSVFITVILAIMLTYVLLPAVEFLCSRKFLPFGRHGMRLVATIIVFVAFFIVVGVSVRLMMVPFIDEAKTLGNSINDYNREAQELYSSVQGWYEKNIPEDWRALIGKQDLTNFGSGISKFVARAVNGTMDWLKRIVDVLMIPVLAFYFVLDSRRLKREFIALVPGGRMKEALRILQDTSAILQSYIIGQLILCVLAGVITGVFLHLIGMNYALVLAVFAAVTRAIPIIGPVLSGIPICILGALQFQSTSVGLWLILFVTVMHFAESKFIMPILIGDRMKLHPAVILIALLIGAELFGIMGMFLAAPIAAIARELIYLYVIRPRQNRTTRRRRSDDIENLIRSESL